MYDIGVGIWIFHFIMGIFCIFWHEIIEAGRHLVDISKSMILRFQLSRESVKIECNAVLC